MSEPTALMSFVSVSSDGQKRQAEAGDGGRPVQHPADEEEEEGEEGSRPQEATARAGDRGELTLRSRISCMCPCVPLDQASPTCSCCATFSLFQPKMFLSLVL